MATGIVKTWQTRVELDICMWHSDQTDFYAVTTHDLRYNTHSEHKVFQNVQDAIKEGARRARLYYFYQ